MKRRFEFGVVSLNGISSDFDLGKNRTDKQSKNIYDISNVNYQSELDSELLKTACNTHGHVFILCDSSGDAGKLGEVFSGTGINSSQVTIFDTSSEGKFINFAEKNGIAYHAGACNADYIYAYQVKIAAKDYCKQAINSLRNYYKKEKDAERKSELQAIIKNLNHFIGQQSGHTLLQAWLQTQPYKEAISTLQSASYFASILNIISNILVYLNPCREEAYARNEFYNGNKYLFYTCGPKQTAEKAVAMAEDYFQHANLQ